MAGKKSPPTVRDVVAAKSARAFPEFTPEQRQQVADALEINDAAMSQRDRVTSAELHRLLTEHYGFRRSVSVLERMAAYHFKRASWGRK